MTNSGEGAGLDRWEVILVYRPDLINPHDKFCICADWDRRWFLYINSKPPKFGILSPSDVEVYNYEVFGLWKETSYINTAAIIDDVPEKELMQALADPARRKGPLNPNVVLRVQQSVESHKMLTIEQRDALLR